MFSIPKNLILDGTYIPSYRLRPGSRSPYLTIVLHGLGDSRESFDQIDRELKIPGMNYLVVNAPTRDEDGYSWYRLEPHHKNSKSISILMLQQLIFQLRKAGWKSENIFLLGHSQGALMVGELGLFSGLKFAGIVGVSGYFHFSRGWKARLELEAYTQNWLFTHGTRDRILPIRKVRRQIEKLKKNFIRMEWMEYQKGHDMDHRPEQRDIAKWIYERMVSDLVLAPRRRKIGNVLTR